MRLCCSHNLLCVCTNVWDYCPTFPSMPAFDLWSFVVAWLRAFGLRLTSIPFGALVQKVLSRVWVKFLVGHGGPEGDWARITWLRA